MKKFLIFGLLFLLVGCDDPTMNIDSRPVQVSVPKPAEPLPLNMQPVTWTVITKDNIETFTSKLAAEHPGKTYVFVALTAEGYKNLLLNITDLKRYIQQQQAIIIYYQNVTKPIQHKD